MRIDVYSLIHKAQREHLFKLSIKLAKMDFSNSNELIKLKEELAEMIAHLRKHSESEERFIHPFYENFQPNCTLLESQHEHFENELAAIENLLDSAEFQDKIYSLFNRFIAQYLLHIDQEEQMQREILWQHYSDKELGKIYLHFQQSLTLEENMKNMEFMLPCLNVNEVKRIFYSTKENASKEILERIIGLIKSAFSPLEWQQING